MGVGGGRGRPTLNVPNDTVELEMVTAVQVRSVHQQPFQMIDLESFCISVATWL